MLTGKFGGSRGQLRLWSVAMPLVGLAILYPLRAALLRIWPAVTADAGIGLLMAVGVLTFSWSIFRVIERQDRDLARQHADLESGLARERRLGAQLDALHQASLALVSTGTTEQILRHLVELARDLIGARYAALGVLGPQGVIDGFYTAGIAPQEDARPGPPPQDHGLLNILCAATAARRLDDIAADPRTAGFPAGHPSMTSLLGVPVVHGGQVVGQLYLADKVGAGVGAFSPDDERLLTQLAGHAAAVIIHGRLAERVHTLAVTAERFRIGRELHDGVIQMLYAVNLELEDASDDIEAHPAAVRARLDGAIDRLSAIMTELRSYIVGLQSQPPGERPLREALAEILSDASIHGMIEPHLRVSADDAATLASTPRDLLVCVAREAVANTVSHAHADRVWVTLDVASDNAHLRVVDDGAGFDPSGTMPMNWGKLGEIRQQLCHLGGTLRVESAPGQGTAIDVRLPLSTAQGKGAQAHA